MRILSKLIKRMLSDSDSFINDRRDSKRYDLPLNLTYIDPNTEYQKKSFTKNISKKGLRFPVESRIAKGSMLDIMIEDPNSKKTIASKAKVIWSEEFVSGDDADDLIYEIGVKLIKNRLF